MDQHGCLIHFLGEDGDTATQSACQQVTWAHKPGYQKSPPLRQQPGALVRSVVWLKILYGPGSFRCMCMTLVVEGKCGLGGWIADHTIDGALHPAAAPQILAS